MYEADFVQRYDRMILDAHTRDLYGEGSFYNVGCWDADTTGLAQACARLVRRVAAPALAIGLCRPGDTVLDMGCGLGASTHELARAFPEARLIGANLSQAQLRHARRQHPALHFCAMDATRLGLAEGSLRCIASIEAAFHFRPRTSFLAQAWHALQPAGMVLLSDMLLTPATPVPWWAAAENAAADTRSYLADCRAAGFEVDVFEDVTEITLEPFCQLLQQRYPGTGLGETLRAQVNAYVVVALRKP